jgi:16S rRNA (cytidine1402-2'-O)-methyltransferase
MTGTTAGSRGVLYLVGTPIGNLEDITLRALRVLRQADAIAAEDTRVTKRLLERHGIGTPLLSYHEHSGPARLQELLAMLRAGKQVALVSDAGMPGISDPGAELVRAAAEAHLPVIVVPGATAAAAALAGAGFPAQHYLFLGFLPSHSKERRQALARAAQQGCPIVCFEAPHRLRESLDDLRAILGDRQAAVARELTKRFEELVRGSISELVTHFAAHPPRGETTIVIAGGGPAKGEPDLSSALEEVWELVAAGLSPSRAAAHVARWRKLPRRKLYQLYLAGKDR